MKAQLYKNMMSSKGMRQNLILKLNYFELAVCVVSDRCQLLLFLLNN